MLQFVCLSSTFGSSSIGYHVLHIPMAKASYSTVSFGRGFISSNSTLAQSHGAFTEVA